MVVVAYSSKIWIVAFAQICPIELVHELITDAGAPEEKVAELNEAGVAVTRV